ncbi:Hypothetical predicted protein [Octopus vulgaris]|uniref:Uncharacterized protein n=1 Tax=Octopus vulgaris TaxID=6645 RepID=A0AA36AGQ4_OCTVU|nr:Hypothetical predicted protein [Octopus vulgaris]
MAYGMNKGLSSTYILVDKITVESIKKTTNEDDDGKPGAVLKHSRRICICMLDSKTSSERKDEEQNEDSESIAVELKEENEYEAEIIDQKSDGRTEEQISILN